MEEIWKDIKGYEGIYQVSNMGSVKRLNVRDSIGRTQSERILKARNNSGYLLVSLYKNAKQSNYNIHRLVAEAFIPNPENKPQVNHIDEDKTNNSTLNLEWVTAKENQNHGSSIERSAKNRCKSVIAIDVANGEYNEYVSCKECAIKLGLSAGNINNVLKGRQKQTGGYIFKYV